jgi:SET domain-containing protein
MRLDIPSKIYVDNSPIHGLGVFCKEKISKDEIFEVCPVIDMGMKFGESSHILIDYRFNWPQGSGEWTKQVVAAGFGMLYNHSNKANANWRSNFETNSFEFYATKDINPGEEIFVWYGDMSYWNDGRNNINII